MRREALGPGVASDLWEGAVTWRPEGSWWQPWRLFPDDEPLAYAPDLFERARQPAGVRMRASTDGRTLTIDVSLGGPMAGPIDLVVDGVLSERRALTPGVTRVELPLPGRPATVEVWLPHNTAAQVGDAWMDGATFVSAVSGSRPRWVAYGSSITQCAASSGPSETWPALVGARLGLDLTCLGFGAECHLDPVVARTIGALPAELITMCLGINVYGRASFGSRTWRGQVADLVSRVREQNDAADIVLMSPIWCPGREETPNAAGLTLREIRDGVEQVADDLRRFGDSRLTVLSGLDVLGPDDGALLVDGLHPGPAGYRLMADRITPALIGLGT